MKNMEETVKAVVSIGASKAVQGTGIHAVMGILAGSYIALGGVLALKVTGGLPPAMGGASRLLFGLVFPVGLLMVLVAGASLFTGDVMYLPAAWSRKAAGFRSVLRFLALSWVWNFAGSVLVAWLADASGILADKGPGGTLPAAAASVALANMKCALGFCEAFLRGVGCNWLVCLAVYMSLSAEDGVSKAVLMWPPITAFVAMGMEHSVANMCFVPLGIFLGSRPEALGAGIELTATWGAFLRDNLVPVTLGNIAGGVLFVAFPYLLATRPPRPGGGK
ncbi:MAG: formate/nitrite transporter family protein [Deltaproteobacteria bacterium]|jgi:formate/nitrite transporter|nr:formate/nitrite transporter family protein [Deltaproteobacteria bacterium]